MKRKTECRKCRVLLISVMLLALVSVGIILSVRVLNQNKELLLQNEDSQLIGLAQSVDRSVVSYLGRYAANLEYITGRRGFMEAEDTWLTTGESEDMLFRLRENLVAQSEMTEAVLVIQDRQIVLSTNGEMDYRFPAEGGVIGEISIWPCFGEDENLRLAFLHENPSGLIYASVIDLGMFYQRVAGDLGSVNPDQRIMLLDAAGLMLIHQTRDGHRVHNVETLQEGVCDYSGLQLLKTHQTGKETRTEFYEASASIIGEPYTARMAIIPAGMGENRYFTIGVSSNYDRLVEPLHNAAVRLMVYISMTAAGGLLLFFLVLRGDRKNQEILREIAVLKEKNAAVEALSEKTRALAHHQRLETIGTLTSSIAHEFNNLLTPIMGYSILALEKLPSEETEIYDDLLEIYASSRKAKEIITRLSDLSRKNTSLTYQYVAPDELVKKVLGVVAPAKPPRIEVQTELNCRHVWLHGNETQLSQVLMNLVLNAFHSMEGEEGFLKIVTEANDSHIIFRVSDTGCGIREEALPYIFDPFFTTKETGKGTGLGLAIVQQVVEGHHGEIGVETAVGKGTTFVIRFPLHIRQET